jgi:hypothetical protein
MVEKEPVFVYMAIHNSTHVRKAQGRRNYNRILLSRILVVQKGEKSNTIVLRNCDRTGLHLHPRPSSLMHFNESYGNSKVEAIAWC